MARRKVIGAAALVVGLILAAGAVGIFSSSTDEGAGTSSPGPAVGRGAPGEAPDADFGQGAPGSDGGEGLDPRDDLTPSEESAGPVGDESTLSAVPVPGATRVIKTANLQVEIEHGEFQEQFARATTVAEEFGGFVSSSRVEEHDGDLSSGHLTMRVPSDRFEAATNRLKDLGEVTAEDRSGRDVTREFVDLEARLRQARTEEGFFVRLLDEAESISDLIQIQSQLSDVQLRIEQLQGQLNYLEDQTELSTISVRIYEPGVDEEGPIEGLGEAWEKAGAGFQTVVAGAVISLGWLAPFALLAVIIFGIYRFSGRRGETRSSSKEAAKEEPDHS